jgi:hypothetical protein
MDDSFKFHINMEEASERTSKAPKEGSTKGRNREREEKKRTLDP